MKNKTTHLVKIDTKNDLPDFNRPLLLLMPSGAIKIGERTKVKHDGDCQWFEIGNPNIKRKTWKSDEDRYTLSQPTHWMLIPA